MLATIMNAMKWGALFIFFMSAGFAGTLLVMNYLGNDDGGLSRLAITTGEGPVFSEIKINGKPLDATYFGWTPEQMPLEEAVRTVARLFCRKHGYHSVAKYEWVKKQPPDAKRFVGPDSIQLKFCDFCGWRMSSIECSNVIVQDRSS